MMVMYWQPRSQIQPQTKSNIETVLINIHSLAFDHYLFYLVDENVLDSCANPPGDAQLFLECMEEVWQLSL